jgi:hypothetical protein
MPPKTDNPYGTPVPKNPLLSQLIVSAVALAIIVLGGWSMFQDQSPYHPEIYSDEVSRGGPSGLSTVMTGH